MRTILSQVCEELFLHRVAPLLAPPRICRQHLVCHRSQGPARRTARHRPLPLPVAALEAQHWRRFGELGNLDANCLHSQSSTHRLRIALILSFQPCLYQTPQIYDHSPQELVTMRSTWHKKKPPEIRDTRRRNSDDQKVPAS